jgi:hypothetical protein
MPKVFNWWRYVAGLYNSLFTFTGLYGSFSQVKFAGAISTTIGTSSIVGRIVPVKHTQSPCRNDLRQLIVTITTYHSPEEYGNPFCRMFTHPAYDDLYRKATSRHFPSTKRGKKAGNCCETKHTSLTVGLPNDRSKAHPPRYNAITPRRPTLPPPASPSPAALEPKRRL